jgi:hypothetical protein
MRQCNWSSHASQLHLLHAHPILSGSPSVRSKPIPLSSFFPSFDMPHQLESAHLRTLFEPALQAYEERAGVSLAQHPLAINLQSCDTVEAITGHLRDHAQPFIDLQGSDRITVSIKSIVTILSKISSAPSLVDAFGPVRQNTFMPCLTPLTFIYRHSHLRG